ncbi:MAG: FKBP-type peptidyl-prolyl cis-trans isomerase [Gammaproteobacteria bacterium]|nr:FKBP-type peptidyl-prolyl cis-trans isomerase [Gammaproteobacteria bacterium]
MQKILTVIGLTLLAATSAQANLTSYQDKLSYSMGVEAGQSMHQHGVQVNPQAYGEGIADGYRGGRLQLSERERQKVILAFEKQSLQKFKQQSQQATSNQQTQGQAFLAANKNKPGVKTLPSGLQYKIIQAGIGPQPKITDTVEVDYAGRFINGKVFDSSYARGKSLTIPLQNVIKGWQQALPLMKVQGTWEIFVPANLAYGPEGVPGAIGPNQTLIFKIHLIGIK